MNNSSGVALFDEANTVIRIPGNAFFIVAPILIIFPNVFALVSMWKSKGIALAIKVPIMNLLLSGILTGIGVLSQYVLMHIYPAGLSRQVCYCVVTMTYLCALAAFLTITSIAIDRCICLYFEYAYIKLLTARRVVIVQGCVWGCAFCYAMTTFIDISPDFTVCINRDVVGVFGYRLQTICGLLIRIVTAFSYILIYVKMRRTSKSNGANKRRMFMTTSKLLFIGLTYHVMYFPIFCHALYLLFFPDEIERVRILFLLGTVLSVVNIVLNPLIYAWRFPECRLHLKTLLCFWNKDITTKENERRKRILVSYLDPVPDRESMA